MQRKQTSLTKCTRIERLAQLSEQEIVIERKKKEIQAKIDAQKKKETEEALKKLESANDNKSVSAPPLKKPLWRRYDRKDRGREKEHQSEKEDEAVLEGPPKNAFSNDGSFLDQFKKLSSTGLGPNNVDVHTIAKARKREEDERERLKKLEKEAEEKELQRQKRDQERKQSYSQIKDSEKDELSSRDLSHRSPTRKPLDSNIQLQLPPPGVVQLVPQHQVHIVPPQVIPVVHQPIIGSATLPLVQSSTVPLPVLQSQVLNAVPPFRTNEIQLQAISSPSYTETLQLVNNESINTSCFSECPPSVIPSTQSAITSVPPPLHLIPQNIPPPSPIQVQNIPPPPLPPKKVDEPPKIHIGNISMAVKNIKQKESDNSSKITDISDIPTPPSLKGNMGTEPRKKKKKRKNEEYSVAGCSPPPPGYFDAIPLPETSSTIKNSRVSPALSNEGNDAEDDENEEDDYNDDNDADDDDSSDESTSKLDDGKYHLAKMVARCGDDVENLLRARNQDDPTLRFLFKKKSKKYHLYRKAVLKYRRHPELLEKETLSGNSDTDDHSPPSKRNRNETKEETCGDRFNQEGDMENFSVSRINVYQSSNEGGSCSNVVPGMNAFRLQENEFMEQSTDCVRLSADGQNEPNFKSSGIPEREGEGTKLEERKRKRKSRWGDAAPPNSSLKLNPAGPPPTSDAQNKPQMLTQVTRTDPGLLQYARHTFGSVNLSEEDWKKAEDHYKINLLYHDLCKKRAEIDKLQRAGKFKYEYDSDEDVEGGTWEHKLRQQEMLATQLWAEELTRQAAGKHHIGDFLPPEELERFMEKYNAVKEGREPDLSDYKEFKLKEDNVGYQLLQKMGWSEGQGLGQNGSGIVQPVSKATTRLENQGLGIDRPDGIEAGDDEYDAYRKRMMLAYRFRPNPLNNPRRPYY